MGSSQRVLLCLIAGFFLTAAISPLQAQVGGNEANQKIIPLAERGDFKEALKVATTAADQAARPQLWENRLAVLEDANSGKISRDLATSFLKVDNALRVKFSKKRVSVGLKELSALIAKKGDYAPFWSARASLYGIRGDASGALQAWNRALELAPDNAHYYNGRGNAYGRRNRTKALADYAKALERSPKWPHAILANRGSLYSRIGRTNEALRDFHLSIAKRKNNPDAYYDRGNLYSRQKQFDKAVIEYSLALKYDPIFLQAYTNRGVAQRRRGRHRESIADHTKALSFNPRHVTALMGRAFAYSATGKTEAALTDIRKATGIQPRNFRLHMTHAMIANRAKLLDEEIKALRKVLQTLPPNQSRRKAQTRKRIQQLQKRQVR